MTIRRKRLAVSLPDTVLEEKDSPREKTAKLGTIARACSIYGVDVVEVFRDPRGRGDGALIAKVLGYLETPQYLRKRLFPLDEALRFAGVLPPLRIPSHRPKVPLSEVAVGEVREGVMNADGTVDVGLDVPPRVNAGPDKEKRVTVRITSKSPLTAELIRRDQVKEYWGYALESRDADKVFTDSRFALKVATSRLGKPLSSEAARMGEAFKDAGSVKMVFGSPSRGLFEIFGADLARKADFVVNLFNEQNVETVRTEEAIFAGLNLLNILGA
ncbi:MAG: hypothetical protein HY297_03420 [Thaumarchaeota archaeon]|nr:hypothetical protein [Nitrososphaerota archaeon]